MHIAEFKLKAIVRRASGGLRCNRPGGAISDTGFELPDPPRTNWKITIAPMKKNSPVLTIQQVSARCGVSKSTLRFWEAKFRPYIFPDRSKGGQRRYAASDIAVITLVKRLKAEGFSLNEIQTRLSSGRLEETLPVPPSLDHLAQRIAGLVREEIYQFLQESGRTGAAHEADPMPLHRGSTEPQDAVPLRD